MLVENNSNKAHFDAIYGGGPPSNDDYARSTYSGYRESVRSDKIPATPMVLEDSSATLQGMEEGQGVTKKGAIPGEKRKKECPRCCWWIFGIVMVLLLAAGLTTFFLWPRQPDVKIIGYEKPANVLSVFEKTDDGFKVNMAMKVLLQNPNFIDVTVRKLFVTGYSPDSPTVPLGTGELRDITFSKKANTTFIFPFSIIYSPKLSTTTIRTVLTQCGLTGSVGELTMNIKSVLDLKLLSWTGIMPEYSTTITFICPVNLQEFSGEIFTSLGLGLGTAVGDAVGTFTNSFTKIA